MSVVVLQAAVHCWRSAVTEPLYRVCVSCVLAPRGSADYLLALKLQQDEEQARLLAVAAAIEPPSEGRPDGARRGECRTEVMQQVQ